MTDYLLSCKYDIVPNWAHMVIYHYIHKLNEPIIPLLWDNLNPANYGHAQLFYLCLSLRTQRSLGRNPVFATSLHTTPLGPICATRTRVMIRAENDRIVRCSAGSPGVIAIQNEYKIALGMPNLLGSHQNPTSIIYIRNPQWANPFVGIDTKCSRAGARPLVNLTCIRAVTDLLLSWNNF